ncbi:hypothetical protein D3C72_1581410 [compost metagenome]
MGLVLDQQAARQQVKVIHVEAGEPGRQGLVQIQQFAQRTGQLVAPQMGEKIDQHSATAPRQEGQLLEQVQILFGLEQGAIQRRHQLARLAGAHRLGGDAIGQ